MLDLVLAKMLAKSPDDRYATASELVADLRECRKLTDAPAIIPAVVEGMPADQLPDQAIAASVPPVEEHLEVDDVVPSEPPPTLGFSRNFDSLSAVKRLAEQTGTIHLIGDLSKDKVDGMKPDHDSTLQEEATSNSIGLAKHDAEWTKKDKVTFAASVAFATAVAMAIVLT